MPQPLATLAVSSQIEWEQWLDANGTTSPGVWLRLAKKGAGCTNLSYAEALDSALCFGWIDGQKQAENVQFWLQRFSPRSSKSIWSKINTEKAQSLQASGRMRPTGLQAVELAKKDGRWERAYRSASNLVIPDDFQLALDGCPNTKAFFIALNNQNRHAILFRIQNVKKAETRTRKIAQFIEMLAMGQKLYP